MSILFLSLSVITFRSCGDLEGHENVTLQVDPIYSGGVLSLTPYIVYEGEEDATFQFGSAIAWIDQIKQGEDVLYEYEEESVDVDQQTTLETDDERGGFTVDIEVEPGSYEVHMSANYFIQDPLNDENGEELQEYFHEKIQTIEIQTES